jgi:hypothetical protein
VSVVATSRERLDIGDEAVFALSPMTVGSGEDGELSDSARLFVARAAAVLDGFSPDPVQKGVVESICRGLDGLPLAIELAAARLGALGLDDVHERLGDRFRLLTRRHDSDGRHQSLLATIAWSYDLLSAEEQRVFEALSVFVGDFDLVSAVAVAGGSEDVVISLVDKSVLVVADGPTGRRYRMLETVREFAHARLAEHGDVDAALRRHLDRFLVFVADANQGVRGRDELRWHRALLADWHNVRTAMATACEFDDGRSACRLVEQTLWWIVTRLRGDADDWVQRVRQLPSIATLSERPIVTIAAAFMANLRGDVPASVQLLGQARTEEFECGDLAEPWVSVIAPFIVEPGDVIAHNEETVRRAQDMGSAVFEMLGVLQEGVMRYYFITLGNPTAAEYTEHLDRIRLGARLADELGNPNGIAYASFLLGGATMISEPEMAEGLLVRAIESAVPLGLELLTGQARVCLAKLCAGTGRRGQAFAILADSIRDHLRSGALFELPHDVLLCATLMSDLGDHATATRVVGSVRAAYVSDNDLFTLGGFEKQLATQLGAEAFAELHERGRRAGLVEVAREMLDAVDRLPAELFERATIEG